MSTATEHDPGPVPAGPGLDAVTLLTNDVLLDRVRALQGEVLAAVQAADVAGDERSADVARRVAALAAVALVEHLMLLDARLCAGEVPPRPWQGVLRATLRATRKATRS
jgi:hypothetical protein